ncbi:hypothetical protein ACVI1I_006211 [Bradyrhizobium sp. USDA 4459]
MTSDQSSERHSISHWAAAGEGLDPNLGRFFADLQREENEKAVRLSHMSEAVGLPIYPTATFRLPDELPAFVEACRETTLFHGWQLAIRFAHVSGRVVYRRLGITADDALEAARAYNGSGPIIARVAPYREPERSGTLWVQGGEVLLELVLGPHYWISKWGPTTDPVLRCRFSPYCIHGQYSTCDLGSRELLYRSASAALRSIFGCNLRQVTRCGYSVYAEFHWHRNVGYRYIDCSFSTRWTASRVLRKI